MEDSSSKYLLGARLDSILEEVAGFEIDLETDPTQPHLGARYLNETLAKCRNFTNRAIHYLQLLKRQERTLKMELKMAEADIDFKMMEKLADDVLTRQQASIEDRKAYASVLLREEHMSAAGLRAKLLETEETVKLVRMRLDNLRQTSMDIKLQRQIVKDDRDDWHSTGEGYSAPTRQKDKTVEGGMQAPVRPRLDPSDLLDPGRRPADLPEPVDGMHAAQIADFFNSVPEPVREVPVAVAVGLSVPAPIPAAKRVSYQDLLKDD